MITSAPATITVGGCQWPLVLDMRAVYFIEQRYRPGGNGLDGLTQAQTDLAAGLIEALAVFAWVGLLHENPRLTFAEALSLLDEATPAELAALPLAVMTILRDGFGASDTKSSGAPWDWEMALAVWIKEWGRSEAEFWAASFRTFRAISNGLSRLYESAKQTAGQQGKAEGWSLHDLMAMQRGRR